ncbi:DUF5694 domain-containing protein [Sphingomonas crocodyli]|uniref:TraB/GumN family protein n=1 Tax=Sphingomonas crocodyli TaxID=1979270 RepID=A0A437M3X8_9SPHN|nr:DUF5694 domain-containing protein [Sphingomonas crocodyli]RVT92407.1 hypothetical protein EOD43_00240 [Sphingomonas crocodyli]
MNIARHLFALCLAAASLPVVAAPFDPGAMQVAGPRTQMLVLGTPHLGEFGESFRPELLGPLLDRLAAFRPDVITIEGLSGPDCEMLIRYKPLYPGVADDFCWDPAPARDATGLDMPAAEAAVDAALKSWPAQPTAGDRRHLAALFLASGDRASALVQWLRLPEAEQHAGDGLDAALVAVIEKQRVRANENYQVAAVLAARLGLERVYPTDDHSSDRTVAALGKPYEDALRKLWSAPNPFLKDYLAKKGAVKTPDQMLAFYRYMNDPKTNKGAVTGDMGGALKEATPPYYGRQYVGWWDVRNLRMIANIRSAFADRPGARVLSIVGATHKLYFDAYLRHMAGVDLVDTRKALR